MAAFLPHDLGSPVWLTLLLLAELAGGYALQKEEPALWAKIFAWAGMASATLAAHLLALKEPAGFRMLALIAALFLGMKAVVGVSARAAGEKALTLARWSIFTLFWAGMRPVLFSDHPIAGKPWKRMALQGLGCALVGALLMLAAGPLWRSTGSLFLVTVFFFIGSSLLVHYGLFTLGAAFWKARGFNCEPLFRNPLTVENLTDFWGKYWNLAYREMIALAVYRPLKGKLGPGLALFLAFALSGLFHEVAISVPVRGGFGLPLLYFLLQGILVGGEKLGAEQGLVVRGIWGRIWTFFWLIAPLPILFHGPFLRGIIWPLMGGAR
ncbi:MAG TPA: membrane bound O-acyl transferase family-domain-containing protein [bacterium]|nr:membrane bound O-acyl transferase family-domain-containing protein [bacterium]